MIKSLLLLHVSVPQPLQYLCFKDLELARLTILLKDHFALLLKLLLLQLLLLGQSIVQKLLIFDLLRFHHHLKLEPLLLSSPEILFLVLTNNLGQLLALLLDLFSILPLPLLGQLHFNPCVLLFLAFLVNKLSRFGQLHLPLLNPFSLEPFLLQFIL